MEEGLVICMPADGMITINVQVEVTTIWPFHHAVDATRRHHLRHEVHHPRWKWRWRHLEGTVGVLALAAWLYQPRCLSRHGPLVTRRLQPLDRAVDQRKIHVALLGCPNTWKVASKASSFVVPNRVLPSLRRPVLDQCQADLLPGKFPPLAKEFVGNCRTSFFVFLLRLLFLFLLLFFMLGLVPVLPLRSRVLPLRSCVLPLRSATISPVLLPLPFPCSLSMCFPALPLCLATFVPGFGPVI